MVDRTNSYEILGYDFMLDTFGKVWLIECNAHPDLSHSTSVTKKLVIEMMADLKQVVHDEERFPNPMQVGVGKTGTRSNSQVQGLAYKDLRKKGIANPADYE